MWKGLQISPKSVILVWLVRNAVFSETAIRIFLIFCIRLEDIKVEESQSWFFEKNCWFRDIGEKLSKLAQIRHFHIFVKSDSNNFFFSFWTEVSTKYEFQLESNLFFTKICNLEIFDLKIVKQLPKLRFLAILWTLHH